MRFIPWSFILLAASACAAEPTPSTTAPTGPTAPALMTEQSAADRLLTCKAAFQETVQRHFEASKGLSGNAAQAEARRAAVDQALALAVLNEALPEAGDPEDRHLSIATNKRIRGDVISYCRSIVMRYVDIQSRERPRYLLDLRPAAEALVADLDTAKQ